ncbi:MAG: hypothetical protein RL425_749 [Pseudomonadota bacterium]|jgi:hypothetical protein
MKAALPLVALLVSACAGKGDFPSLNPRPIEAEAAGLLQEPDQQVALPRPSDPKIAARIEAIARPALDSDSAFDAAAADAERLMPKAGSSGSDSWVQAQMRVSALERSRYAVKSGLAELDNVRRELMAAPKSEDLNTLEDRIRQIEALDARQDAAMQRLQAALSR